MKTTKIIALLALAGFCFFPSCKDDDVSPLTAEEAKVAIASADDEFVSIKGEVFASPGMMAQEAVYGLGLPFNPPMKSFMKFNLDQMEPLNDVAQFAESKGGYGPGYLYFPFNEYVGTWEYEEGVWTKVLATPTDKIVVEFSFNGGTDNATLTYSDYQTKPVPYAGKAEETYISQLKAKIDIDGQTNPVMTWVYTANRTLTGGTVKTVTTYGSAFTLTQQMTVNASTSGVVTIDSMFEVKKSSDVVYSKSFEMTITGVAKTNVVSYTVNATAKVQIFDVVIYYTIVLNQDTDTSNPGNFMTVTLKLTNGAKIADVVFEGPENDPYFKFSDGTTVAVPELLSEDLFYELGEFMDSIMGFIF
ncbi:MAG TPA: hypothetical protein PLH91_13160 [Tenuifilaceae bacterium]|nr:hypothetical protein [Tenuifilaceae bacterium]